jgi:hypothetical protein
MESGLPKTYYELHSDELKLLQFLLYHLKTKHTIRKKKIRSIEVNKDKQTINFD